MRVLVADDSDLLVGLIASWLEDEGFAVVVATTGRQALDAAALHHPDIVLLDLIMPQMDGFEVCGKLRRLPQPPEIILMTGVSDAGHLHRAMDLCAGDVVAQAARGRDGGRGRRSPPRSGAGIRTARSSASAPAHYQRDGFSASSAGSGHGGPASAGPHARARRPRQMPAAPRRP